MPKSFLKNIIFFFSVKKFNKILIFKALCFKMVFSHFFFKSQMKIKKKDKNNCPFLKIFASF